jgi:hypothetical protein
LEIVLTAGFRSVGKWDFKLKCGFPTVRKCRHGLKSRFPGVRSRRMKSCAGFRGGGNRRHGLKSRFPAVRSRRMKSCAGFPAVRRCRHRLKSRFRGVRRCRMNSCAGVPTVRRPRCQGYLRLPLLRCLRRGDEFDGLPVRRELEGEAGAHDGSATDSYPLQVEAREVGVGEGGVAASHGDDAFGA